MLSQRELDEFLGDFSENKTTVKKVQFPALSASAALPQARLPMEFVGDVIVDICAELGKATLTVKEILNIKEDYIIELEKAAGDNINLKVNGQEFAKGEVIIIGNNLGIRVDRILELGHSKTNKEAK
ncbi:MAG TPA: hypothetical protein DEF34_08735 [Desulfotomaculum sp.]|nr:MAG: hypothetical protein VR67_16475 [Peptococcaceae bacterium BRH_c8a]KJS76625.1 MAG: hypothetical protein JL56_04980 [Desulfotomaculum sp. BICA1-6]HBX23695.1 hypothetical protein [Desulfotomaculum sp.]